MVVCVLMSIIHAHDVETLWPGQTVSETSKLPMEMLTQPPRRLFKWGYARGLRVDYGNMYFHEHISRSWCRSLVALLSYQ